MICSLLGQKFSSKCKHSVKCIKCRMETIRKKKQAMVKYLKKVVADLISGGHETNAFGRMDDLIVEINQSSCYDMIENYCCCILEHLPTMQKERVCPEVTVEAIATLIFAAARFPDLPELADLRNQFTKRYGTQMESYINEEFVEKMKKKSFSQDQKLWLMRDIAQEFSIHWDFKAFEHKISHPSAPTSDQPKIKFSSSNENGKQLKSEEHMNAENVSDYQKTIQMRKYDHQLPVSTEKIDKVAADDFKTKSRNTCKRSDGLHQQPSLIGIEKGSADSANAVNIIPPYTKILRDFDGSSAAESGRTFNLRPPYVKPKITTKSSLLESRSSKLTNYEISNGGNYLMNSPFSIRRTAINGDFTVKAADLLGQIPIKEAGAVGKKNSMHGDGDVNDHRSFVSLSFERREEVTNGTVYVRHHLQRAFSDRPRHDGRLS